MKVGLRAWFFVVATFPFVWATGSASAAEAPTVTVSLVGSEPRTVEFEFPRDICRNRKLPSIAMRPGEEHTTQGCWLHNGGVQLPVWRLANTAYQQWRPMTCVTGRRDTSQRCWVFDSIEKWKDGIQVPIVIRWWKSQYSGMDMELSEGTPSKACPAREWTVKYPQVRENAVVMVCYQKAAWNAFHDFASGSLLVRQPFWDTWRRPDCCRDDFPYGMWSRVDIPYSAERALRRLQPSPEFKRRTPPAPTNPPSPSPPANPARCAVGIGGLQDRCGTGTNHFLYNLGPSNVSGQVLKRCKSGSSDLPDQYVSFSVSGGQKQVVGCSQYDTHPFPTYCGYSLVSCN